MANQKNENGATNTGTKAPARAGRKLGGDDAPTWDWDAARDAGLLVVAGHTLGHA
jgi:hypothetical protein